MAILKEVSETSSSSSTPVYKYDVFLSFRGVDTRLSFTNHLHTALVSANLATFLDNEEIQTGEEMKPELENAIKASRASIIVLSKNYASSRWCLDELVLILEQHKIIIPIFYHVEPTDVRKQQNSFGDAMAKHIQRMKAEKNPKKRNQLAQKMELWKKALLQVADLKGKDAKGRKETEFITEIVNEVFHRLGAPLRTTQPLLIGADYNIEFISSWLKDGSLHTADILTVLGIGGIGKTSLARYIYGIHCRDEFDGSSFIEDISRKCLFDVQRELFHDISHISSIVVHDVYVYTSMIENALASKKVFVVLDDIDSLKQLDALLGNKCFHPGSKIIITTKDGSLTERCALFNMKVQPKHTQVLLNGLYETEALELLCIHAFKCQTPKKGYKNVVEELIRYCGGHPLALEVLGKSLHNRDVAYWEGCIKGLKKGPHSCVQSALQMSFDSLPFNDKELFKHIACFFVGADRDVTETILEACGIDTRSGITNLRDKCLLSIGWRNMLKMHQLVQEMGRDLVRQESPHKSWERSRSWCHEESFMLLKQKRGKENLIGLALDMRVLDKDKLCGSFKLNTNSLNEMDSMMLLQLNHVQVDGSFENIPEELRWLCMHGFPLKSIVIPSHVPLENLVVLDMSYSKVESFGVSYSNPHPPRKRQKLLGSLKILDMSFCKQLHSLGGFLEFPVLQTLIVKYCTSLFDVCESIEQCVDLVVVDMSYCYELQNLPILIAKLKKVNTLLLDGCNSSESRIKTRVLDSISIGMHVDDIDIDSQTSLSAINFMDAIPSFFKSLAISFTCSLVSLSLKGNSLSNESFPNDLSSLCMLKDLYLDGNPLVSMPNCVRSLPSLEKLSMRRCYMLTSIEHPPRTLRNLVFNYGGSSSTNKCSLRKVLFDPEMFALDYIGYYNNALPCSSFEISGMIKIQPMAGVEEKVFHILGWSNLDFLKKRRVGTYNKSCVVEGSQTQMYYEFGIFSTIYGGKEMPNWIKRRNKGLSISFTIPSSPKKLRGLNFCWMETHQGIPYEMLYHMLPMIKISNTTKDHTWIYKHYISNGVRVGGKSLIYLSHWMFGLNEMEGGDQVSITVIQQNVTRSILQVTSKCGVRLVYDDGKTEEEEEDVLGYYKSWNHIIGGDLSSFQTTSGEYILKFQEFTRDGGYKNSFRHPFINGNTRYKGNSTPSKAFSGRKSHILDRPSQKSVIKGSILQIEEDNDVRNEAELKHSIQRKGTAPQVLAESEKKVESNSC